MLIVYVFTLWPMLKTRPELQKPSRHAYVVHPAVHWVVDIVSFAIFLWARAYITGIAYIASCLVLSQVIRRRTYTEFYEDEEAP